MNPQKLPWMVARELIHFANNSRTDLNEGLKFGDIDCEPNSNIQELEYGSTSVHYGTDTESE